MADNRISARMRDALQDAARHSEGLRRTFDDKPGRPTWPHHPSTLHALVRHGLLEPRELRNRKGYLIQAWFITDAGRDALKPMLVVRRDTPRFLAPGGGYTTNPKRSIDRDEIVDMRGKTVLVAVEANGPPNPVWRENAERHRKRARSDVNAARLSGLTHPEERLRELRRMAAEQGVPIHGELRIVERGIAAVERKLRQDAA